MSISSLIKKYSGFSRSERVGTLVLILFLALIVVLSLLKSQNTENLATTITDGDSTIFEIDTKKLLYEDTNSSKPLKPTYFTFNPNTVLKEDLLLLGLSQKQANTFVNYRNSGAKFYNPKDIRKVYGIPPAVQDSLVAYIIIPQTNFKKNKPYKSLTINNKAHASYNKVKNKSTKNINLKLNINTALSHDFENLPGIGEVLSKRIIKYRELLGGFISIQQLNEVYGIDSSLTVSLKKHLILDLQPIKKIDFNLASYSILIRHPYVNNEMCKAILYYKRIEGKIESLDALFKNKILDDNDISKLKPYAIFGDTIKW